MWEDTEEGSGVSQMAETGAEGELSEASGAGCPAQEPRRLMRVSP